jgi:hypothetical protein
MGNRDADWINVELKPDKLKFLIDGIEKTAGTLQSIIAANEQRIKRAKP